MAYTSLAAALVVAALPPDAFSATRICRLHHRSLQSHFQVVKPTGRVSPIRHPESLRSRTLFGPMYARRRKT